MPKAPVAIANPIDVQLPVSIGAPVYIVAVVSCDEVEVPVMLITLPVIV